MTLRAFADQWLKRRDLKPRTREHYRMLLDDRIYPVLGDRYLTRLDASTVEDWYFGMPANIPTVRAHAYGLLRTILNDATGAGLVPTNPCRVRGAGTTQRAKKVKPATLQELAIIAAAMPDRLQMMVVLSAWCGLRFGEVTELRRRDISPDGSRVSVSRAVTRVRGEVIVGTPKSSAGIRDVAVPPHLRPALLAHIERFVPDQDGLLFPAADGYGNLAQSTFNRPWDRARREAARPDLRFHDLRHTGAVLAAQSGATLAELMARLGHTTSGAAMRYQHAAQDRDLLLAERMSDLLGRAE